MLKPPPSYEIGAVLLNPPRWHVVAEMYCSKLLDDGSQRTAVKEMAAALQMHTDTPLEIRWSPS